MFVYTMRVILPSRSCGSLFVDFVYQLDYSFFYLGHFVCHIDLLRSFSDNFVYCLSLLDQGHSFDAIIYHHIILFHYFPFAVVHHIISSA
jgi:hypothetical protein